ncbi:bifunctional 2-polyprenyl-6-hydroxyphenol methylase/3-demethylubiquinol 3-O-methyltransferase UbiG [Granulicella sp. L60]|jgi:SAM-dependent methyltransferase|uniref:class I SAM-dependent methyltransferase n=1 Tax=Granulicella sp. L60 TaxID=1641866 RepID=UPI00131D7D90|nr:class I SAM-dependent methyltransferase [Granulicella sp. L60]
MSKLRSYAPVFMKRIIWNWKHQRSSIDPARCPQDLLECVRTLESNSGVLDLGCGAGNLRAALRSRGWNGHFIGVDVSEQVMEIAKKSEDSNAEWHVSAIENFPILSQRIDAICFCESIYYVKPLSVPDLLARCRQSLVSGGRIVIRIWDADLHREYITLLVGLGAQSNPPIYILAKEPAAHK